MTSLVTQHNVVDRTIQEVDFTPANQHALEVALSFARAGIKTFPAQADKKPVPGFNWATKASCDPDLIASWYLAVYKDTAAMVGMPCGANGLVAIDPDRPKPISGKTADGLELFLGLVKELDIDLTGVPVIQSPSGGRHYIFAQPTDGTRFGDSRGGLPENIDVKGEGYLIASGSRRADGVSYQQISGTPSLLEAFQTNTIPQMPSKLAEIIGKRPSKVVSGDGANFCASGGERMAHHLLARALLPNRIPNDSYFDDRTKWLHMACAIYGASGGESWGRQEWLAWNSRRDQTPGEPERTWDTLKGDEVKAGAGFIRQLLEDNGHTDLLEEIKIAAFSKQGGSEEGSGSEAEKGLFTIDPFELGDITAIPPRQVIYKHHTRKFLCGTFAPGGVGKSTLTMVEAVAMALGKPLLGVKMKKPLKVYVWNGEDPMDELHRRVAATILHYGLGRDDRALLEENLFLGSGREQQVIVANMERGAIKIAEPLVGAFEKEALRLGLDVVILDPFVSTHLASEQDNGHMNLVASTWARLAHRTNTSIELVHHVRKTGGEEVTLDDARGAGAITNAMRYARVLNVMTEKEGDDHGIENRWSYIREGGGTAVGKANLQGRDKKATWYTLHGVGLGNATMDDPADNVATLESWEMPQLADDLTDAEQEKVIKRVLQDPSEARESPQAKEWAGKLVAIELGLDVEDKADASRIKKLLGKWVKDKKLKVKKIDIPRYGREVPVYVAGSKRG